jgi:hypothetical protein
MAWEQVGAWSRTYDLLMYHESRLKTLQLELSAAWPPDRSPAAAAFADYIDGLLARVVQARHDAGQNRKALQLLLEGLASAKKDMAPLKSRWDQYEREESNRSQNLVNGLPHSGGQNWQEDLNEKARARMTESDRDVFEATQLMSIPAHSNIPVDTDGGTDGDRAGGIAPSEGMNVDTSAGALSSTGRMPYEGSSEQPGPQLAGVGRADPPLPNPTPSGSSSVSTQTPAGATPAVAPIGRASAGFRGGASSRSVGSAAVPRHISTQGLPAASPAVGVGVRPASGSRVNPVGGVIAPASTGMAGIPPTRHAGGSATGDGGRDPVPTMQWEVASGGPPVIEPAVERPFVLGPGVIGIDR